MLTNWLGRIRFLENVRVTAHVFFNRYAKYYGLHQTLHQSPSEQVIFIGYTHTGRLQLAGCHISEFRSTAEGREMKGSQSHEFETDVPASELWEIYGTLRAAELLPELLPHILAKVELVSGDGGVGTILQLTFPPGIPGLQGYKEKFIKVDNENYIKEAEAIDGDILKLGFLSYMIRFEIIGKGPNSSVIRSTVEYEIGDGNAELESMVSTAPLAATAERFAGYIKERKIAQISS